MAQSVLWPVKLKDSPCCGPSSERTVHVMAHQVKVQSMLWPVKLTVHVMAIKLKYSPCDPSS